jgi:mono/diheme cytochrome c family protein
MPAAGVVEAASATVQHDPLPQPAAVAVVGAPAEVTAEVLALGKDLYTTASCIDCHGSRGRGRPGRVPPLFGSEYVQGPVNRLIRIITQGVEGPIEVRGQVYDSSMPSIAHLNDNELAALLTYIRKEFGDVGGQVSEQTVAMTRAAITSRNTPWTEEELKQVRPDQDGPGGETK